MQKDLAEKASIVTQNLEILLLSDMHLYHMIFRVNDFGLSWLSRILWGWFTVSILYLLTLLK